MTKIYAGEDATVKPATLNDETLIAIGRLVRASAEVEDLVTLFICSLAGINVSKGIVMLGKMGITQRLAKAEYLANMAGGEAPILYKACFDEPNFRLALSCRNALAHGVLMGEIEEGRLAFLTSRTEETDNASAIQIVESYTVFDIQTLAEAMEASIPQFEKHLKLGPWRAERQQRPLLAHRKGRRSRTQGE